jgi:hypothetical protein
MRTKILLASAAALALGVVASNAQVYSANVVGYVQVVVPASSFLCVNNPLDNGATNQLNTLFSSAPNNTTVVWYWNGTTWINTTKRATGFTPVNTSNFQPGVGFFVQNTSATPLTNIFVGNVIQGTNSDNVVYPSGYTPIGDVDPLTGTVQTTLGLPAIANDKVWTYDPVNGWQPATRHAAAWSGDYYVPGGSPASGEPVINVAQGFFIQASSVSGGTWTNSFTVQ